MGKAQSPSQAWQEAAWIGTGRVRGDPLNAEPVQVAASKPKPDGVRTHLFPHTGKKCVQAANAHASGTSQPATGARTPSPSPTRGSVPTLRAGAPTSQ